MRLFWRNAGLLNVWLERFMKKQNLQLSLGFKQRCGNPGRRWGHSHEYFIPSECPSGEVETSAGPAGGLCTMPKRCSVMGEASTAAAFCAVSISQCSAGDRTYV